jgi:glycosyltransferase involved in cell wall biosynthesis
LAWKASGERLVMEKPAPNKADKIMRVAMIGPFGMGPKGTMRVRALPLAQALAARGHRVTIVMPPWQTPEEAGRTWSEEGVALEYVARGPRVPLFSHMATTLRLVRRALACRPDVIHCFKPKAYAGLAAWLLWHLKQLGLVRARLVVDEDDWEGPGGWNDLEPYSPVMKAFFAWQERWGLRHHDGLTVASRALQTLVWSLGVSPERVHYVPNGIVRHSGEAPLMGPSHETPGTLSVPAATKAALEESLRRRYALGTAPVVLLYTRFFEYDPARVVAVWRGIVREIPYARLLVVGKALFPQDDATFNRLVREAGLAESVARAGWVAQNDLPAHLAVAAVALYPFDDTLVNRCKCAVKLTDLMAAGVPVVADAVGQNTEYIAHNETGILVPSGDTEAMIAATLRLLRQEDVRRALGDAAAACMTARFAWPVLVERVLAAYGFPTGTRNA